MDLHSLSAFGLGDYPIHAQPETTSGDQMPIQDHANGENSNGAESPPGIHLLREPPHANGTQAFILARDTSGMCTWFPLTEQGILFEGRVPPVGYDGICIHGWYYPRPRRADGYSSTDGVCEFAYGVAMLDRVSDDDGTIPHFDYAFQTSDDTTTDGDADSNRDMGENWNRQESHSPYGSQREYRSNIRGRHRVLGDVNSVGHGTRPVDRWLHGRGERYNRGPRGFNRELPDPSPDARQVPQQDAS